jgi:hypothetical protein
MILTIRGGAKKQWVVAGDPRLEFAQQSHGQHQTDSDFIPSDDYGYGYPVFGTMPDLNARASTASDQGTLAGCWKKPKVHQTIRFPIPDTANPTSDSTATSTPTAGN